MPRLKALQRQWAMHPPVHLLVAAYLGYEAPVPPTRRWIERDSVDEPIVPQRVAWMHGMGAIPATDELRNASTSKEALAALERMFMGNVVEL